MLDVVKKEDPDAFYISEMVRDVRKAVRLLDFPLPAGDPRSSENNCVA